MTFDALADDLHVLLSTLELRGVVLAGFAMGPVKRPFAWPFTAPGRVKAAVLVAPPLPFLLKTHDSPDGIDRSVFDGLTARIAADQPAAMKDFLDRSYNVDLLGGHRVGDDQDRVLPYQATGSRLPALLKNASSTVITGGPYAIIWTHADEVNQALLDFIGHRAQAGRRHR